MSEDLGVQFFTAAKAQHESVGKWQLIVLAVLLYLHLAIVGPFAKQSADKAAIDQELARSQAIESQLAPIIGSAGSFVEAVQTEVTAASGKLRDDLVARFGLLNQKVTELAALGPEKAAGEDGAQLFRPRFIDIQQQAPFQQYQQYQSLPLQPLDIAPTLAAMPPDLRGRVADAAAGSDPQYLEDMERYIDEFVIAPAFTAANASWAAEHRQTLSGKAGQLDEQLQSAITGASGPTEQLERLRAAVAALRDEAQRLEFAPPANSDWWRTVMGKETSIRSMMEAMTRGVDTIGKQQGVLQAARDKTAAIVAQNRQRAKEVADRLAELERQAADLQAQLGQIGEPLKVISVRLPLLAPLLPLVIALAAAALAIWGAEALRRMQFAAALIADDAQRRVLRRWLQAAAGGHPGALAAREIAIALVMAAWLLVAWQAVRSLPAPLWSDAAIVGFALVALVCGRGYHWYRSAQALAASSQP